MKRFILLALVLIGMLSCKKDPVNPPTPPTPPPVETPTFVGLATTNKAFPTADETFTLTFDPAKGNKALISHSGDVYMHIGVITNLSSTPSNWRYVKSSSFTSADPNTKMTKQSNGKYTFDINPRTFLSVPTGETIQKLAILFRNADGSIVGRNADGSDIFVPIYPASTLSVRFSEPEIEPTYDPKPVISASVVGDEVTVTAYSSQATNLTLSLNNASFATASNATKVTGKAKIAVAGQQTVKVSASGGAEASFTFTVGGTVQTAELPVGTKLGINYINNGASVVLALYAPQKQYIAAIGDFNNWTADANAMMKRTPDGTTWWVQLDGLDPNKEYAYQYLVDGNLKVADPYTEKILDPWNDASIPAVNYANIGSYPTGKTTGIVSTFKANQTTYSWKNASFARPAKNNLVIYELLLRDFLQNNNYSTLTDTLNYLSNMGVNAIELMPINEFEGNSSWGYNPDFYFAPDKYYGSKYYLQRFIDECHSRGIAVIMDMVLNHSFGLSPMVQLYFDGATQKPAANNPWFNVDPKHPFNVGYDFNHESAATKLFAKNVMKFWMQEYKIDGFRFDLSKGFTQTNYGTSDGAVGAWSAYDAGRIAIWKDYNSYMKTIDANNFYVILEHFAADNEEKELSNEGMMFWNNINYNMNEATMGWLPNSNFSRSIYTNHGFTQPDNLITYMESHDEERLMFKNITYGNAAGSYSVKDLNTALNRQKMAAAFLFAIPGPKMIWQFGELGYDISIDQNGRTGEKPVLWNYNTQPNRIALKQAFSKFINFKKKNNVFNTTNVTYDFSGAIKYIKLQDASNTVIVVGNFDVNNQTANVNLGTASSWYDAANSNQTINLGTSYTASMAPGEYHIFTKSQLAE